MNSIIYVIWRKRYLLCVTFLFAGLTSVNIPAQNDPYNFGRDWMKLPDPVRSMYLEGFRDGQSHTYMEMIDDVPQSRKETLRLATFTMYESAALRDVMTSLYSDPANTFITFDAMVYIARDKLSGKDIEPMLRLSRQHDRGYAHPPQ